MENQNLLPRQKRLSISLFFLLLTCAAGIAGRQSWQIPNGVSQSMGVSFSPARMALLAGLILAGGISLVLFLLSLRRQGLPRLTKSLCEISARLTGLLWLGCLVCLPFLLTPLHRFGSLAAIVERLQPFFLLAGWGCASGLALVRLLRSDWEIMSILKLLNKPLIVFFALFFAFAAFIKISGWGISAANEVWYDNAVPLLPQQVALVLLISWLLFGLLYRSGLSLQRNRLVWFFVIWIIAAVLWQSVPMNRHFFAPGPYPPDGQFYPYSDAMGNDMAAQSALQGLGFNFGGIVFKPVVSFLIYLLTLLSGNQVNATLAIQSALFAILPALLFLMISEEVSFLSGLIAAGLQIFHEINALNSDAVLTVHSRLEMSEFLAEILFVLFVWAVFKWLKNDLNARVYAVTAGGILALLVFTRFNFVAMLPALLPFSLIVLRKNLGRWAATFVLFTLAFLLALSPWLVRSYQLTGKFAPEIFDSFQSVVVDQRLSSIPEEEPVLPQIKPTSVPSKPTLPVTAQPETQTETDSSEPVNRQSGLKISTVFETIANHTLHNLSGLLFVLPTQVGWDSLSGTYQAAGSPWQPDWKGTLTFPQSLMMILNGLVLSAGLAVLWKKYQWRGMTVLYLTVVYAAALGIARTSGGRYLVPINWSMIYLASIGLGSFLRSGKAEPLSEKQLSETIQNGPRAVKAIWLPLIIVGFASVYLSMILIEKVSVPPIEAKSSEQLLQQLSTLFPQDEAIPELSSAVEDGKLQIYSGKALYSRFYYFNQGESGSDAAYKTQPYSRWVFRLLQPDGFADIVLPTDLIPETMPNASDVIVVGCLNQDKGLIDALAVYTEPANAEPAAYNRYPERPFECPLAEPTCPATNECY